MSAGTQNQSVLWEGQVNGQEARIIEQSGGRIIQQIRSQAQGPAQSPQGNSGYVNATEPFAVDEMTPQVMDQALLSRFDSAGVIQGYEKGRSHKAGQRT